LNYITTISEFLGHEISNFALDGEFHHFEADAKGKKPLWVNGFEFHNNNQTYAVISYGDFRSGLKGTWKSYDDTNNEVIEKDFKNKIKNMKSNVDENLKRKHKQCRDKWQSIYDASIKEFKHPYLAKKKIDFCYGAGTLNNDTLLVPLYDNKNFNGVQKIDPFGNKKFSYGIKLKGSFCPIGNIKNASIVYLSEGYATACSVYMATHTPVICVFNSGNIIDSIKTFKKINSKCKIIICADNDQFVKIKRGFNPGIDKAKETTALFKDCIFKAPLFRSLDTKPTDFNDLHVLEGLEIVSSQLRISDDDFKIKEINQKENKKTKEIHIVNKLLKCNNYSEMIIQDNNIFSYSNGKWNLLKQNNINKIKLKISELYGEDIIYNKIESIFRFFCLSLKHAPVDMFEAKPNFINFKNCTLKVEKNDQNKYVLNVYDHNKKDYLTNQIPYNYEFSKSEEMNKELDELLERVFKSDEDKANKIKAISQLYGACLLPFIPRIFFLHGVQGSGKSTILKIIMHFMGKENISTLEPNQMNGFNLEIMCNKLANIVTDINGNSKINDSILKMIEDATKITIQRKYQSNIIADIPRVMAFGMNKIPDTFSGESRAYERRITFISFNKTFSGAMADPYHDYDYDKKVQGFDRHLFEKIVKSNPQGIINFAIKGIREVLANNCKFINPKSGIKDLKEWQEENDIVFSFLNDDSAATWIAKDLNEKIKRSELSCRFKEWCMHWSNKGAGITRNKFYKRLRDLGYNEIKSDGVIYFRGLKHAAPCLKR